MTFGNGSAKGNGTQRPPGKSLTDHMRDAIAFGYEESMAAAYVISKVRQCRISKRRLVDLFRSLQPNKENTK